MREIKFRAWDRVAKQMWDGNNIIGPKADYTVATQQPSIWRLNEFLYELSKGITLLQFTGLHDKNGKEIYEGDVVKFRSHPDPTYVGEVRFGACEFYILYFQDDFEREKNFPNTKRLGGHLNMIEVIGNIYENPNLLSADKMNQSK